MHRILSRCFVVALAAGLGASAAQAQFETSYHDNGDHTATLTLTFHNDTQNKTFKDLHVLPLHGSLKLPQGNPSLPSGWSQAGTTSSKGLHLQTDGSDQIVWEGKKKNVCHTETGQTWPSHFAG